MKKRFLIPTEEEIRSGKTTDAYFSRTMEILKAKNKNNRVVMEAWIKNFPDPNYKFGIFTGIEEVAKLLEGLPVDVYSFQDGEVFFPNEPVLQVEGRYRDFGVLETAILGFICQGSGVATKATRIRIAAGNKKLISFGTRRCHPALAPIIERSAFIAGFDGVSNVLGAELMGEKALGTIPHSLILVFGGTKEAFEAYSEIMPRSTPRIALIDTFGDCKKEMLIALEVFGKDLDGVRIDSGNLKKIFKEIRKELNARGRNDVEIFLSSGLNEYRIQDLAKYADGFGVGTSVAATRVMDFALKIIEVDNKPFAKVGNPPGAKQVYRDFKNFKDYVTLRNKKLKYQPLLKPVMKNGKIVKEFESPRKIRARVLERLKQMPKELKELTGSYREKVKFLK